ncbi:MAG: hypothetical protein KIY11_03735 [Thermoplasmata archaeon]|nr:hypothetical protein [Candidatus Sysuiplasma acidicola]
MRRSLANSDFYKQNKQVIDWLLEDDQPSVRYYTLLDVLDRKENDAEVRRTHSQISRKGWARDILKLQKPGGYWEPDEPGDATPENLLQWLDFMYRPKYVATNWRAIVLSDLGLTRKDRRIVKTADLFFRYRLMLGSMINWFNDEVCIVGNTARMLTRFGYADDHRVRKLYDRLLEDQKEDGGWHCFPSDKGTLDGWEALAAFAALPKSKRTAAIERSIARGAEFYLERKLFEEGKRRYEPWFRFHYPVHYYYDILTGLDLMTGFGYADDRRLLPALKILKEKRQSDGTWHLDKVHPDIAPGAGYDINVRNFEPFALEEEGMPSKWITLKALRVLKRVHEAG